MAPQTKDTLEPGTTFGRYKIVRLIGRGGMGAVYEALHIDLKKKVAVKALLPSVTENQEVQTRFLREGQAAARIRHPHVADTFDVGTQDGVTYLVMEYLEGQDLGDLLKKEGPLDPRRVADIMTPVAAAILVAHGEGIIHRDLKPANIFLAKGQSGEISPKVLDFGISKVMTDDISEGLTNTGAVLGTPFYMSPEQARGDKNLDARSDQYSLGVILYQLVTGKRPFQADSMYKILHKIVEGDFDPPRVLRPDLPEALERVILRAMARLPSDRYTSVKEMGAALLMCGSDRTRAQWAPTFGTPTEDLGTFSGDQKSPVRVEQSVAAFTEPRSNSLPTLGLSQSSAASMIAPPKSKLPLVAGIGLLIVAAGIVLFVAKGREEEVESIAVPSQPAVAPVVPAPPTSFIAKVNVEPVGATVELDGAAINGKLDRSFPIDGKEHSLRVSMAGYESVKIVFKDSAPPSEVKLEKLPAPIVAAPVKAKPKPIAVEPPVVKPKKGANQAPILR